MVGNPRSACSPSEEAAGMGASKKGLIRTPPGHGGGGVRFRTLEDLQSEGWAMPVLRYLADTNSVSDFFRSGNPVKEWFAAHPGEIGISTLTLAEMRRGIELREHGRARRRLERAYQFILEDYHGAIFVFDEAAAMEWGRLMLEARNHPLPYDDSLIGAIARGCGLKVLTRNQKHFPGNATIDPWTGVEHGAWQPP